MSESPSSVHNIETSGSFTDWPTYREYRVSLCSEEHAATIEMYAELDEKQGKARLTLLHSCRKYAWFARSNDTGRVHVCSNSCRQRWCPICSSGRANYITHSVMEWLVGIKHPRFLTLTLKHTNAPLDQQIDQIYRHFRALRKDKQFRSYVRGGIWFFQVVLSKHKDQWHPHIHCLINGKYMPHEWISRKWLRITKTSNIVDIRAVNDKKKAAEYVARYCARPAKLSNYPLSLRVEIFESLHGRRLSGAWGTAKGISLSPPKFVQAEKYTQLGSWSTIHSLKCTSENARTILDCWKNKQVLPQGISLEHVDRFIDDLPNFEAVESDQFWEPYMPGFS